MKEQNRREFLGCAAVGLALAGCGKNERLEEIVEESKALDTLPPKGLNDIKDQNFYDEILKTAHERMHRSTCAEASLQGLQDMWDLPKKWYSWATAGYMGAIGSGQTTCGLLIGSSIAIGFRYGKGKDGVPDEFKDERTKAIRDVGMLYEDFLKEFGSTDCQKLTGLDGSKPEDRKRYINDKIGQKKCDVFFNFVMNRFIELTKEGKI